MALLGFVTSTEPTKNIPYGVVVGNAHPTKRLDLGAVGFRYLNGTYEKYTVWRCGGQCPPYEETIVNC